MLKTVGRRAIGTVPRPLPLFTGTSRLIHSMQPPYAGPPTYETIARRLSSQTDPQRYFASKRQQEAINRGAFVDIHDVGRDPKDYDVLISDVKHETLETKVAEELGIPYLSKAAESQARVVVQVGTGYIYGPQYRPIVPFVVSHKGEALWVFFIVDNCSPLTYLSTQVSASMTGLLVERRKPYPLTSLGEQTPRYQGRTPSQCHDRWAS